ncbi:MAG: hypothetical protein M3490_09215 [Chloroflexota bacterium]|nr:hypothetical protein [Chloroflexota bacterium]
MSSNGHSHHRSEYLRTLRQSRRFLDKPVPQDIIDDLLVVARATGQDENAGAWQFLVIDDIVTRNALSHAGSLTEFLASVSVVIVLVVEGDAAPSKASIEARIADRIMRAAGGHGLGSGTGWFGTDEAQEAVGDILGIRSGRQAVWAVGIGYIDESGSDTSSLESVRQTLDRLASRARPVEPKGDEPDSMG